MEEERPRLFIVSPGGSQGSGPLPPGFLRASQVSAQSQCGQGPLFAIANTTSSSKCPRTGRRLTFRGFSFPIPNHHPILSEAEPQRLKTHSLTGNEELLPGPPSRENMNKMLHAADELPTLTAPGKAGRWATVPGTPIFVLSWASTLSVGSPWLWLLEYPGSHGYKLPHSRGRAARE